jgi:hypothetical protein
VLRDIVHKRGEHINTNIIVSIDRLVGSLLTQTRERLVWTRFESSYT